MSSPLPIHGAGPSPRMRFPLRVLPAAAVVLWWCLAGLTVGGQDPLPQPLPSESSSPAQPLLNEPPEADPVLADEPSETEPQPLSGGELPWADTVRTTKKLPNQRLQSAVQMLEMLGVDESQWLRLEDGRPLFDAEHELLYKILFRIPRFLLEDIERWQHHSPDWSRVAANVEQNRGEMYLLKGVVTQAEKVEMIPELATAYEFRNYYRVAVELADGRPAVVYSRKIPSAWPISEPMRQRVQASAMLFKVGPAEGADALDSAPLIFVANRIAWFPQEVSSDLKVTPDRRLLSSLGMDLGLLDDVTQRTGIGYSDREAFYQMLAAVRHSAPDQLTAREGPASELGPLIQTPENEIGELKSFKGTVRRITRVECDADIKRRLGLSHYYHVDVFIPLDDEQVRLGRKEDLPPGEEGPVFTNSFPFTLCVAKLPKGLKPAPELNEEIRFTAFFFKLWTYNTAYIARFGEEQKQIGPMLIGKQFEVVAPPSSGLQPYLAMTLGVLFVVGLAGLWYGLWRNTVRDQEFQRTTLSKSYEVPGGKSLNEMGLESDNGPDFSNWENRETPRETEG